MRVFIPTKSRETLCEFLIECCPLIDQPIPLYCHFVWNYRKQTGKNGFLVSSEKEPGFNTDYGDFEF